MIPRYSRPQMAAIWTPENRFRIWVEIEAHACDAMAEMGVIPKDAAKAIWAGGKKAMEALKADPQGNIAKIDAIEQVTKHDITAFTTWLAEFIGPDSRFVHQGLTSSDILDTTFAIQLTQASDILLADIDKLLAALKKRALEHKNTLTIGRSHAIHAEPTTFGVKLAGHYAAFARNRARLVAARAEIATCAISGPVGTFANVDPRVEEHVAKKLGLAVEPVSTQIIPRDRHAAFFATLGVIASSAENLATEIRHLQRTEVREAEEFFSEGQKGSSSMPHKRNPVLTENVTGLARLVRGAVMPALENVTLWHERDISHSSTEFAGRGGVLPACAARPHPEGHEPRGGLRRGPAQCDGGVARQRLVPGAVSGRQGDPRIPVGRRIGGAVRHGLPHQARRHDLQAGIRVDPFLPIHMGRCRRHTTTEGS